MRVAPWARNGLLLAGILAVATWAYAPALDSLWHFDDEPAITHSGGVHRSSWELFKDFFRATGPFHFFKRLVNERLLTSVSFALCREWFGIDTENPHSGWHLFDLVLHLLSVLLVWYCARRLLRLTARDGDPPAWADGIAAAAACAFTVHPVLTQGVIYLAQRGVRLATLFTLGMTASLLLGAGAEGRRRWLPLLAFPLAILAFASKPSAVPMPLAAIALLLPLRDRYRPRVRIGLCAGLLFLVGFGVVLGYVDHAKMLGEGVPAAEARPGSNDGYFLAMMPVLAHYQRQFLFPVGMRVEYGKHHLPGDPDLDPRARLPSRWGDPRVAAGLLWHLALGGIGVWGVVTGRAPLVGAGILWFYLGLATTSSFFPIVDPVFDHRLYLPAFGGMLVAAAGGRGMLRRLRDRTSRLAGAGALAAVAVAFLGGTRARAADWEDEYTLNREAVRDAPYFYRLQNNLGLGYQYRAGRTESADSRRARLRRSAICLERAIDGVPGALRTGWQHPHGNLGNTYYHLARLVGGMGREREAMGMMERAAAQYRLVLRMQEGDYKGFIRLADAYATLGRREAADYALLALHYEKQLPPLWETASGILAGAGIPREEIPGRLERLDRAFQVAGEGLRSLEGFRSLPLGSGEGERLLEAARRRFEEARGLHDRFSLPWYGLGVVAWLRDAPEEALESFRHTVAYPPFRFDAEALLVRCLLRLGRVDEARREWERIREEWKFHPRDPELERFFAGPPPGVPGG